MIASFLLFAGPMYRLDIDCVQTEMAANIVAVTLTADSSPSWYVVPGTFIHGTDNGCFDPLRGCGDTATPIGAGDGDVGTTIYRLWRFQTKAETEVRTGPPTTAPGRPEAHIVDGKTGELAHAQLSNRSRVSTRVC
jgi:hypothetical protein